MNRQEINFDEVGALALSDLASYYRLRGRLIDCALSGDAQRPAQLKALQAQIDAMRVTAGSPLLSLKAMSGLLENYLDALGDSLGLWRDLLAADAAPLVGGCSWEADDESAGLALRQLSSLLIAVGCLKGMLRRESETGNSHSAC